MFLRASNRKGKDLLSHDPGSILGAGCNFCHSVCLSLWLFENEEAGNGEQGYLLNTSQGPVI